MAYRRPKLPLIRNNLSDEIHIPPLRSMLRTWLLEVNKNSKSVATNMDRFDLRRTNSLPLKSVQSTAGKSDLERWGKARYWRQRGNDIRSVTFALGTYGFTQGPAWKALRNELQQLREEFTRFRRQFESP
jgi:hypothetical protein